MRREFIAETARRLSREAEAVCRRYLSAGRREGRYWLVGDVDNTPGRSLYVRLKGAESGKGAAGKWTDAATGDHGDLLDLIGQRLRLDLRGSVDEARRFLALPRDPVSEADARRSSVAQGSPDAARRLFAMARSITGTHVEAYLLARGVARIDDASALRFHPRCFYRERKGSQLRELPALIAAVTDEAGAITGVHRTWLDPARPDKADIASPRRAMGHLLGHGVRFGFAKRPVDVLIAGEGVETMLSLRMAAPSLPMIAALSANHLGALLLPASHARLYVAIDADPAGRRGREGLVDRALSAGVEVLTLSPLGGDFNDDLRRLGLPALVAALGDQLLPQDADRFLRQD